MKALMTNLEARLALHGVAASVAPTNGLNDTTGLRITVAQLKDIETAERVAAEMSGRYGVEIDVAF